MAVESDQDLGTCVTLSSSVTFDLEVDETVSYHSAVYVAVVVLVAVAVSAVDPYEAAVWDTAVVVSLDRRD